MLPEQIFHEADLKYNYQKAVMAYVQYFCNKHGVAFTGWVCDDPGTVGYFDFGTGSSALYFEDVRFDIDNHVPLTEIFIWYDEFHDGSMKKDRYLNFQTWCRASDFWDYLKLTYGPE